MGSERLLCRSLFRRDPSGCGCHTASSARTGPNDIGSRCRVAPLRHRPKASRDLVYLRWRQLPCTQNPDGLIRAFAKSGLAEQGWTLVLKTKHLHDRPEAARDLIALAQATEGVQILEISLHGDEVTGLIAAADIYASPHCSEGFWPDRRRSDGPGQTGGRHGLCRNARFP